MKFPNSVHPGCGRVFLTTVMNVRVEAWQITMISLFI